MFSRFNTASKRVLRAAEQECRNQNHYYVGVEHLLLALLEEHDPQIEEALARAASTAGEFAAVLRHRLGTNEERLWDGILVTPRARRVIALAEEAAGDGPSSRGISSMRSASRRRRARRRAPPARGAKLGDSARK